MTMTANTKNGRVVALDLNRFNDKREDYYFCPFCKSELVLKAGDVKIHHFAHKVKSDCIMHGESQKHLEGKTFFYNLDDTPAEFEKRVENRIGDVVLGKTVIEIQNSNISVEEIRDRFNDWNKAGYSMMWILTDNQIDINNIKLKGWHEELLDIYGCLYVYLAGSLYKINRTKIYYRFQYIKINYFKPIRGERLGYGITKFKRSLLNQLVDKIDEINYKNNFKENNHKLNILENNRIYYKTWKNNNKYIGDEWVYKQIDNRIKEINKKIDILKLINQNIYELEVDRIEIEDQILRN